MNYEVHLLNSFTGEGAEGNPAGVVVTPEELNPVVMQEIAMQVGFSETAFVTPLPHKKGEFRIRWFTTVVEVPLCGHATLAAAALLLDATPDKIPESSLLNKALSRAGIHFPERKNVIRFHSQSGILEVFRKEGRYILDFPADNPVPYDPPENLMVAMNLENYVSCVFGKLTGYLLIQVRDEEIVEDLSPNFPLLKGLNLNSIGGITVTARSNDPATDFVSRFFDPWAGIMEDPVTGSAHTLLAPYWQPILNKKEMVARQISSRGGILYLQMKNGQRVLIGGNAEVTGKRIVSIAEA